MRLDSSTYIYGTPAPGSPRAGARPGCRRDVERKLDHHRGGRPSAGLDRHADCDKHSDGDSDHRANNHRHQHSAPIGHADANAKPNRNADRCAHEYTHTPANHRPTAAVGRSAATTAAAQPCADSADRARPHDDNGDENSKKNDDNSNDDNSGHGNGNDDNGNDDNSGHGNEMATTTTAATATAMMTTKGG